MMIGVIKNENLKGICIENHIRSENVAVKYTFVVNSI